MRRPYSDDEVRCHCRHPKEEHLRDVGQCLSSGCQCNRYNDGVVERAPDGRGGVIPGSSLEKKKDTEP